MIPEIKTDPTMPRNAAMLLGIVQKPVILAPGERLIDLSLEEMLNRSLDWEATARHSAVIKNIGDGNANQKD